MLFRSIRSSRPPHYQDNVVVALFVAVAPIFGSELYRRNSLQLVHGCK